MAIAFVPTIGNHRQLTHLPTVQAAVRDCHPEHIGVKLQIEPVHQPQGFELIFRQRTVQSALNLGAKLCVALADKITIKLAVFIHFLHFLACRESN